MRIVLLAVALLLILLLALASRTRRRPAHPVGWGRPAGGPAAALDDRRAAHPGAGHRHPCRRTRPVRRPAAPARPVSVVVELLGYLGGTLAIVGAGLLAARFWPDLASWARLSLVGLVAMTLWAAGAWFPSRPPRRCGGCGGCCGWGPRPRSPSSPACSAPRCWTWTARRWPWGPGWRPRSMPACCGGGDPAPCSSWPVWPGWRWRPGAGVALAGGERGGGRAEHLGRRSGMGAGGAGGGCCHRRWSRW